MLGNLDLRDGVGLDGRGEGDAVGRDAAAAGGDIHGDVGGAAEGGAVFGICEAGQVREEGAAAGLEGQSAARLTVGSMHFLHKCGTNDLQVLGSIPNTAAIRSMDAGYALLFALTESYVKNGGPPAQPPAWLQPPAQQSGGKARSAARMRPARIDEGLVGRPSSLVGAEASAREKQVAIA